MLTGIPVQNCIVGMLLTGADMCNTSSQSTSGSEQVDNSVYRSLAAGTILLCVMGCNSDALEQHHIIFKKCYIAATKDTKV